MPPVSDDGGGSGVGGGTTAVAGNVTSPAVPCLGKQGVRIWARKTAGAGIVTGGVYETSYDHGVTWNAAGDDAAFVIVGSPALTIATGGHAVLVLPAPVSGVLPPAMKATDVRLVLATDDAATFEFKTSTL